MTCLLVTFCFGYLMTCLLLAFCFQDILAIPLKMKALNRPVVIVLNGFPEDVRWLRTSLLEGLIVNLSFGMPIVAAFYLPSCFFYQCWRVLFLQLHSPSRNLLFFGIRELFAHLGRVKVFELNGRGRAEGVVLRASF